VTPRPLDGVVVVALEQAVAGPFCTFQLAELGATVWKIERAGTGDLIRQWDSVASGLSAGFVWVNAGKRSVALDLSGDDDRATVRALCRDADVFVENFAPGAAARLGFGPDALRADNPGLVYCSLSGYGPYRDVKAYDLTLQGESGILLTNGHPGHPAKVGLPITDLIAGSTAALGIVAALHQRTATGTGTVLDIAMLDSALSWLGYFPHHAWHAGAEPPLTGMRHQYLCPNGPYLAADDRYVCLVVADDRQWARLCADVLDRPEWTDDERMSTVARRGASRAEIEPLIEAAIREHPRAVWLDRLAMAGIPHGTVRTMAEVLVHPQAVARQMFVEADSPAGPLPLIRSPLGPPGMARRLPALGEHTECARAIAGHRAPGPATPEVASGMITKGLGPREGPNSWPGQQSPGSSP
jgi:itaconate CoA-transferase